MPKTADDVIKVACPSCGSSYKVPATQDGKKLRCQKCGEVFRIAASGATASADSARSDRKESTRTDRKESTRKAAKDTQGAAPSDSQRGARSDSQRGARPDSQRSEAKSSRRTAAEERPQSSRRSAAESEAKPARGAKSSDSARGKSAKPAPVKGKKRGEAGEAGGERRRRKGAAPGKKSAGAGIMLSIVGLVVCLVIALMVIFNSGPAKTEETAEGASSASAAIGEFKLPDVKVDESTFALPSSGTSTASSVPASQPASSAPASQPASSTPASQPASSTPASQPASSAPASSASASQAGASTGPRRLDYPAASSVRSKLEALEEEIPKVIHEGGAFQRELEDKLKSYPKDQVAMVLLNVLFGLDHQSDDSLQLGSFISQQLDMLFQPTMPPDVEEKGNPYDYDPTPEGTQRARLTTVRAWYELWDQGKLK